MQSNDLRNSEAEARDANRDPLTGEPGAHPVGVGTGAAGGGIAGAAIGAAIGGPIGAGVGAVVGAVSGGLGGKATAEALNPTAEHEYWRSEFKNRPYAKPDSNYDEYAAAYQYGWESQAACRPNGKTFEAAEPELSRDWESRRGKSRLSWSEAKEATHDAWNRVEKGCCGPGCE